eukprot:Clim_evm85s152 gene=Clim_evmTU85s152
MTEQRSLRQVDALMKANEVCGSLFGFESRRILRTSEVTVDLFIEILEALIGQPLPGVSYPTSRPELQLMNARALLRVLERDLLQMPLGHIQPQSLTEGNENAICDLVDLVHLLWKMIGPPEGAPVRMQSEALHSEYVGDPKGKSATSSKSPSSAFTLPYQRIEKKGDDDSHESDDSVEMVSRSPLKTQKTSDVKPFSFETSQASSSTFTTEPKMHTVASIERMNEEDLRAAADAMADELLETAERSGGLDPPLSPQEAKILQRRGMSPSREDSKGRREESPTLGPNDSPSEEDDNDGQIEEGAVRSRPLASKSPRFQSAFGASPKALMSPAGSRQDLAQGVETSARGAERRLEFGSASDQSKYVDLDEASPGDEVQMFSAEGTRAVTFGTTQAPFVPEEHPSPSGESTDEEEDERGIFEEGGQIAYQPLEQTVASEDPEYVAFQQRAKSLQQELEALESQFDAARKGKKTAQSGSRTKVQKKLAGSKDKGKQPDPFGYSQSQTEQEEAFIFDSAFGRPPKTTEDSSEDSAPSSEREIFVPKEKIVGSAESDAPRNYADDEFLLGSSSGARKGTDKYSFTAAGDRSQSSGRIPFGDTQKGREYIETVQRLAPTRSPEPETRGTSRPRDDEDTYRSIEEEVTQMLMDAFHRSLRVQGPPPKQPKVEPIKRRPGTWRNARARNRAHMVPAPRPMHEYRTRKPPGTSGNHTERAIRLLGRKSPKDVTNLPKKFRREMEPKTLLEREFPGLPVPEAMLDLLREKQAKLTSTTGDKIRTGRQQDLIIKQTLEQEEKRLKMAEKDLATEQRVKNLRESERSNLMVRRAAYERKRQEIKLKQHRDDLLIGHRRRMMERRSREELLFRQLYEDILKMQRERVREMRQYALDEAAVADRYRRDVAQSLASYYRDQLDMATRALEHEQKDMEVSERAQRAALNSLKREIKADLEDRIKTLQAQIEEEGDILYFRTLDADQIRADVRQLLNSYR